MRGALLESRFYDQRDIAYVPQNGNFIELGCSIS